ncbi:Hypothetical predicted protein [Scomber scombrus]|uniref:Uncharacterized protein n=1 Tax=Scomber scombrus TaxID=13677 RepID=A0AAV1P3Y1_SCOSC
MTLIVPIGQGIKSDDTEPLESGPLETVKTLLEEISFMLISSTPSPMCRKLDKLTAFRPPPPLLFNHDQDGRVDNPESPKHAISEKTGNS